MQLSERIKTKAKMDDISFRKLAQYLDIPYDRLYKWVQGKGEPKNDDRVKLLSWLDGEKVTDKYGKFNTDPIQVRSDLSTQLGEIHEKLIGLQAQGKVDAMLLLELRAKVYESTYASEHSKRDKLIHDEVKTLLEELRKLHGDLRT